MEDIQAAIQRHQAAVDLTPDNHSEKARHLNNLGNTLNLRFERYGDPTDIDLMIAQHEQAVNLTPDDHPAKPIYLNSLGNSFEARFARLGNPIDINNAIARLQEAANLTPDGHPDKAIGLTNLGCLFESRFQHFGDLTDINNAVLQKQAAVDITPDGHPNKHGYLNNLANSLRTRFDRLGNMEDINTAIVYQHTAAGLIPDIDLLKPMYLSNLGNSFGDRFKRLGNLEDIDEAVIHHQKAVELTPDDHPDKPRRANNLGNSLRTRFARLGKIEDLDYAVSQLQAAVKLTPDGHPSRPLYLNNLGASLDTRFERLGNVADRDEAIVQRQAAVNLASDSHPQKHMFLSNLGMSLLSRFEGRGSREDVDNGVAYLEKAVDLTPGDHPLKPMHLTNHGICLGTRFSHFKAVSDIDTAIRQQEEAVRLIPDDHLEKPTHLSTLGSALRIRFEHLGNVADMEDAISKIQLSVDLTPDGHPEKSSRSSNLGNTYWTRFGHLHLPSDAEKSIHYHSIAAMSPEGPPTARFEAARRWISIASSLNHASLLSAYECALDIMPRVAWLGLPIADRHQHLIQIGGTTRDAAAAAISLGEYEKALEWLEQGRSIVWTQVLQLRTPVDRLREVDSGLADHIFHISRLLDRGPEQKDLLDQEPRSMEEEGRWYRSLTSEWERTVEKIRSLPDFADFLRPPKATRLIGAAQHGPVVVVNIAEARCDALALLPKSDKILCIPLPRITSERIVQLRDDLRDLLSSNGIRMREPRAAVQVTDDDDEEGCKWILSELWECIVKPVLTSLKLSPHPETLPHIWWCSTGALAFLPMHAAGIYEQGSPDLRLTNYVISSYTPTLSKLLQTPKLSVEPPFRMLSVIEPSAPGASHLPNTQEELRNIRKRLADREHIILEGSESTKKRVMKAMEECNWLHLACHGTQKPMEPTKSALLLRDGHLTLEEIIKLRLPNAEFAFLSACQTTTGDETLSEEAVHIAAGMLLAGYRSVVATMWSIQDELAPEVADEFYAHMMETKGRPDSRKAAEALHFSIEKLRQRKEIPLTAWIPFVHLGL